MSGIDEQKRDFPECGCPDFQYWFVFEMKEYPSANGLCFNPDKYLNGGRNRILKVNDCDKQLNGRLDLLDGLKNFIVCDSCERHVTKDEFEMIVKVAKAYMDART